MWLFKDKENEKSKSAPSDVDLSTQGFDLLQAIDAESIVVAPGEFVIYYSNGISNLNLIKDERVQNSDLLNLVRAVRRSGVMQEATLELPRGPIGAGTHDLLVRVTPLGDHGLIAILIFDDSEIRRLDSIRRDFVANISHELKTPIGALSILSEAVLEASEDPEAVIKFANRMQTESKRLTELVQEIIDLSRLQDDDPLKDGKRFDIAEVIHDAMDQSKLSAQVRKITLFFESTVKALVNGDRSQLSMAIHNLIENAINYSPDSTRVAIDLKVTNQIAEISISDQGIGIPEKDIERIFERFYRVDPARSRLTGGTGLGLSIVKHIALNHGGDVSVWSVEGAGSTFTLRFPIATEISESSK
ncbi:MAG: histidine kinase [Actinobacteria bacterium]|uniref:histidine kinase n=1 Tax=freshwater metagenome TaxID=449393 RepID=A0A6J6MPN7_9ZZZZ|nr:histidine kinase [Actinomycetota bacterium]